MLRDLYILNSPPPSCPLTNALYIYEKNPICPFQSRSITITFSGTIRTMKANVLSLSGLRTGIVTLLTCLPIINFASSIDSSSTSDDSQSQSLATSLPTLDERKADWAYDSWTMICADSREVTFDCQAAHFYCDNDGYLRRLWENGRGDGGCPFFCRCWNMNPKPQCLLGLTGTLSCLKRDLGQDEHDPSTLAARQDTISATTRTEPCTVATDGETETQVENGENVPGTPASTIEPHVKPGSAPYVGDTVVLARSKAAAGKWSSKVVAMLNGVRKLAVRVKAQERVDHSTPDDIVENFEPQVKSGAPPRSTPLTSGSTKAMAGKWSQKIADVFNAVHKPTTDIEKRKGAPIVVATSPATRHSVPFWARIVSTVLSSLNRLVR